MSERFFGKSWMVSAAVAMGLLQLGLGLWLSFSAEPALAVVRAIGAAGVLGGIWMFFLAYWTKARPILQFDAEGFVLRAGPLSASRRVAFARVERVEEDAAGTTCVHVRDASVVKLPMSAFAKNEGKRVHELLRAGRSGG